MTAPLSNLDTERFGFRIARIDDPAALRSPDTIETLRRQDIRLIIARIDSERLVEINAMEDLGFRIKDMQVTWRSSHDQSPGPLRTDRRFRIREASTADVAAFRGIAEKAFDNYGHYFADGRLDKDRCRQIYPDWAERTLTGEDAAHKIFVAEAGDVVAGFLSFKLAGEEGNRHAVGIMGAVAPAFRGQNAFSLLVTTAGNWVKETSLAWQEHNTLTTNYPVNRVFARLGFRQVHAFVTLHCWLDGR